MNSRPLMKLALGLLCLFASLLASPLMAQEPMPPEPPKAEAKPPEREISIYIPYTKLKSLFEKDGRGVFITYEKFQELLKAAQATAAKLPELKLPVDGLITEINSEATVARDVVLVKAKLSIELLSEGWIRIPLRLGDSAIRSAKIGDQAARIIKDEQGYTLLVEKKEAKAQTITLDLEYSKAFTKSPGSNRVAFQAPQAAVNHWQIRLAEPGIKVNIHPQVATTDGADKPDPKAKETLVQADVGAVGEVSIDWTPKAEGAAGLEALATVQTRQEVIVEEGVIRSRVNLAYDITRSELKQLTLEVSADYKVINVFDANVQKWEVTKKDDAKQTITVQLFQPAKGAQNLNLELERVDEALVKNGVKAPTVKAVEAGRQFGVVAVRVSPALRAEVTSRNGLAQLDANELPPELAGQAWAYSYRFAALPFELALDLQVVEPRIEAIEFVEAFLEPQQLTVDYLASLNIDRAGIFSIDVAIPAGFEVRSVVGRPFADVQPAAIDSHHLDAETNRLTVQLARKAQGKVAFVVQLIKRINDPKLLSPTGEAVAMKVETPRVVHKSLERSHGWLVVYAPEALKLNPTATDGLRLVAPSEALGQGLSVRDNRFPNLRESMAYAFFQEAASLALDVERRKPQVTVRQMLTAHIESGVVKYNATFHYDIRFSGVKSVRIDVPTALVKDLHNESELTETAIAPQPKGVAADYTALEFKGESELLGAIEVPITWEHKLKEFPVGQAVKIAVPHLMPQSDERTSVNVDRAWGQIAIAKAESIDVAISGEAKGLRPIDPQIELQDPMPGAARAFEFVGPWSLAIAATRYELDDVKRTSIDRALVRVIATRSDELSVQAIYRLRSAHQRLKIQLPPAADPKTAFDSQPLHINGQSTPLERDAVPGIFYVPLTQTKPDELLVLELRFTMPGSAAEIELPQFPDDPAIQKVHLEVFVPQERRVTGIGGPWSDENPWHPPPFLVALGIAPDPVQQVSSDDQLVRWVTEGVAMSGSPSERFSKDGTPRIFSTLSPPPGVPGALRLSVWNKWALDVFVFSLVLVIGVGLVTRPAYERLAALGLLFAVVFLAAVFQPTLAGALLEGPLVAATVLVLGVWFVRYLVWLVMELQRLKFTNPFAPAAVPVPAADAPIDANPPAGSEGGNE